jgi:hypothetical protein
MPMGSNERVCFFVVRIENGNQMEIEILRTTDEASKDRMGVVKHDLWKPLSMDRYCTQKQ